MPKIVKVFRRAGKSNTTEHAIAQVSTTMVLVLAASPYGFATVALVLLLIAIIREVHGV